MQFYNKLFILISFLLLSLPAHANQSIWEKSFSLQASEKYAQAADVLIDEANNNNELAILRIAYLNYLQGNYNKSVTYYKKAMDVNPKSMDAKLGVTLPLIIQKRWRQVKHYSLQVLRQSHWHYAAHVKLLIAEEGLRDWVDLESHAKQLSAVYPTDSTSLVYLARAQAWQGNKEAAIKVYRSVLIRIPAHIEALNYIKNNL